MQSLFKFSHALLLAILPFIGWAQPHQPINFSTGHSGTGANIDVVYHRCYWRVNPDTAVSYIKGSVFTRFKTITNNVSSISFDLTDDLLVDSILYHKTNLPSTSFTHSGNILSIDLTTTLSINKVDSIIIYYQGTPPGAGGAPGGYSIGTDATSGQNFIATLSESYEDKDWWPCKADMQDKIDSIDIIVDVPWSGADTFWVASNGRLIDSTISNGNRQFHYKSNYPIASYLVCFAAARYNRYYRGTINVGGIQVPVVYYIFRGKTATQYTNILAAMDKINAVVTAFGNKWGDYPFPKDKHGFYEGVVGAGGMEHQTFSAIATNALADISTLAHELAHQWFGDKVTFATWNDLWLAEGFAQYNEALAAELVPALGQNVNTKMARYKANSIALNMVSTRIPDNAINNSNQIWNSYYGSAVYNRGSMVVSMLRQMSGDAKFFQAMKNYLTATNIAYKTATSDSLKNHFNRVLGIDITPFFTDYVWGIGNPTYALGCVKMSGNKLAISVANQTQSTGSTVSYFRTPIVLRVQGSQTGQDTMITFFDWGNGNLSFAGNGIGKPISGNQLVYQFSFTPVTITFDPLSKTMVQGSVLLDVALRQFTVQKEGKTNVATIVFQGLDDNATTKATIERSDDGIRFYQLGTLKVNNTSISFTDKHPINGLNYYRVAYNKEDGLTNYSSIVKVDNRLAGGFVVTQLNPKSQLQIQLTGEYTSKQEKISWQLHDNLGKLVLKTNPSDQLLITLDVAHLPPGTYSLSMLKEDKTIQSQMVFIR